MNATVCRPKTRMYTRPDFGNFINEFLNTAVGDMVQKADKRYFTNPAVNILQFTDRIELQMAVPGFSKSEVEIIVENDTLTIKSNKGDAENGTYRLREFNYRGFTKSFRLPEEVDTNAISAQFDQGIILITLNKKKEAVPQPPKNITIQ